tara:strand:- start:108 stop:413 length:306 start_codon:yes stop_codon:yes gene_type:complete
MITLIIGLSLSFVAIGVLYYLNNQIKKRLERNNKALLALHKEFTQYQVSEERSNEKETAKREIRFDNIARSIKKNEEAIHSTNQRMPNEIKKCIKHIELSR